jgi:hypothetical protein
VETILDALLSNSGVVESLTCEIFRKFCMQGKYFQNILLVMFVSNFLYLFVFLSYIWYENETKDISFASEIIKKIR